MFNRYCAGRMLRAKNFNPSVVVLRGAKYPLVLRFFEAFRDARNGNVRALEDLERTLFGELGVEYAVCNYPQPAPGKITQ
jgi:hypothetical protein